MEKGKPTKIQDLTKLFMKLSDQARKNKEKNDKEFDNTAVVRPIENDSQYGGQRKLLDRERIGKDAKTRKKKVKLMHRSAQLTKTLSL
jgi:hypothetical protein